MTNKSAVQTFFTTKTTIIILLIALVSISAYAVINNKESKTESNSEEKVELKSSGLDLKKEVKNIGDVEDVIAKWVETNPEAIIKSVVKMRFGAQHVSVDVPTYAQHASLSSPPS